MAAQGKVSRHDAVALSTQISQVIRSRIQSGQYQPGQRIESIRGLAKELAVSPVTVIKALDVLEAAGQIERIPVKGVFVTKPRQPMRKQLRGCFAFPEKSIDEDINNAETRAMATELYRGLLSHAGVSGVSLEFTHFVDQPSPEVLQDQLAQLEPFDFVIVLGHQLEALQRAAAVQDKLVFQVTGAADTPNFHPKLVRVDYDRLGALDRLVAHVEQMGCATVGVIRTVEKTHSGHVRADLFLERCLSRGMTTSNAWDWRINHQKGDCLADLAQYMQQGTPDFIFCSPTRLVNSVYEAAMDLGKVVGRDFQMAGIATGITFTGLIPSFTHVRIPRFEMGQAIVRVAAEAIRHQRTSITMSLFETELVPGRSTIQLKE